MNRLDFFKKIGKGAAVVVAAPLVWALPKAKVSARDLAVWRTRFPASIYVSKTSQHGDTWFEAVAIIAGEDLDRGDFVYSHGDGKAYKAAKEAR